MSLSFTLAPIKNILAFQQKYSTLIIAQIKRKMKLQMNGSIFLKLQFLLNIFIPFICPLTRTQQLCVYVVIEKHIQDLFIDPLWKKTKQKSVRPPHNMPHSCSVLFLSWFCPWKGQENCQSACMWVCACVSVPVRVQQTERAEGGWLPSQVLQFRKSDTLPWKTLQGSPIRNLVALSQMLLFELKGRGTQDLALPLQSSDKFARKWKRLEPESRLAGYKYRSDIIVGISQVLVCTSGCFLIGLWMWGPAAGSGATPRSWAWLWEAFYLLWMLVIPHCGRAEAALKMRPFAL